MQENGQDNKRLFTGHCRFNRQMDTIGLAEDAHCGFCQDENETAAHIIYH